MKEGTKCLELYSYAKDKIIFLTGFYVCEAYINQVRRTSDIMHYAFYILHYYAFCIKSLILLCLHFRSEPSSVL